MGRVPFDPPYFEEDLPQLDAFHETAGFGEFWMNSISRADIALMKRPTKAVPLVVYRDGEREIIGEAVVSANGHGTFTIFDEADAKNILGIRANNEFSIAPSKEAGGPFNAKDTNQCP